MRFPLFLLTFLVYLDAYGMIGCGRTVVGNGRLFPQINKKKLSAVHNYTLNYAASKGLEPTVLRTMRGAMGSLPDDFSYREGKSFVTFLEVLDSQERIDTAGRLDEFLDVSRSTDRGTGIRLSIMPKDVLPPHATKHLGEEEIKSLPEDSRRLLEYARSLGVEGEAFQIMAENLVSVSKGHEWDLEDGKHFIEFLMTKKPDERIWAISHMNQLVDGNVEDATIKEFIKLRTQAVTLEAEAYLNIYERLLSQEQNLYRRFLSRYMGNANARREVLHLGSREKEMREIAMSKADEYIKEHRKLILECQDKTRWREAKVAVSGDYVGFMSWFKPISSAIPMGYNNFHRPLAEWVSQFVVETTLKYFSTKRTAKIFTSATDSPAMKIIKRYGFARAWGVLTGLTLHFVVFNNLDNKKKQEEMEAVLASSNERELLQEMVDSLEEDGVYERFVDGLFFKIKEGLPGTNPTDARDIDWMSLSDTDLRDENIRRSILNAVGEKLYDDHRRDTWQLAPTSGIKAVDFWTFNALYAIPITVADYFFETFIYGILCKGINDPINAKIKMGKFLAAKRYLSDWFLYFPVRGAAVNL